MKKQSDHFNWLEYLSFFVPILEFQAEFFSFGLNLSNRFDLDTTFFHPIGIRALLGMNNLEVFRNPIGFDSRPSNIVSYHLKNNLFVKMFILYFIIFLQIVCSFLC